MTMMNVSSVVIDQVAPNVRMAPKSYKQSSDKEQDLSGTGTYVVAKGRGCNIAGNPQNAEEHKTDIDGAVR